MNELIMLVGAGWFDWVPKAFRWFVALVIAITLGGLYLILKG